MTKTLLLLGIAVSANASPQLDQQYAVKKMAVAVVNLAAEPVHGEIVEKTLTEMVEANHRFEFSKEAQAQLKAGLPAGDAVNLGTPEEPSVATMTGALAAAAPAHAAVLAEIKKAEGEYGLLTLLVNVRTQEIIAKSFMEIEEPKRLESFARAAKAAMGELDHKIPFNATVLSRDGYRVILDRGMPHFRQGMHVRVYTLESWQGTPVFEETGLIAITRAEKNLSFGRVLADKRPREIQAFNKILSAEKLKSEAVAVQGPISRAPASLVSSASALELPAPQARGTLGFVDAKIGFSMASFNQSLSDGTNGSSGNNIYPTATVLGEILITSRIFFDLGFQFASANVTNPNVSDSSANLGSSLTSWRGQVGYRLFGYADEPSLDFKLGYGSQKYTIGTAPAPFQFATTTYTGLLAGGAVHMPVTPEIGIGLDVNLWMFPSISEDPVTGGASASASGFDFGLRGYYRFSPRLNLEARFAVLNNGAEFDGAGTRATSLDSASHSSKQLLAGLTYFF